MDELICLAIIEETYLKIQATKADHRPDSLPTDVRKGTGRLEERLQVP